MFLEYVFYLCIVWSRFKLKKKVNDLFIKCERDKKAASIPTTATIPQWMVEQQMMNITYPFTPFSERYLYQYFGHLLHLMVGTRDSNWSQATKYYEHI